MIQPPGDFSLVQPADFDTRLDDPLYACACGCGVFEVGTASMFPRGQGGMVWEELDYQDQKHNRRGYSSAPSADNDDKEIQTYYFTTGVQYFFNSDWGVQAELPFAYRHFKNDEGTFDWTGLGDARIKGLYTGFVEDQSVGVSFGAKLPTGNYTHGDHNDGIDRDTQIGTGSTDLLLGAFYRAALTDDRNWNFFSQIETDLPVLIRDHYRPGFEGNLGAGVYYGGFSAGEVTISPVGQGIFSYRARDSGDNSADPVASGYYRVLLAPGAEVKFDSISIYGDVEFPVFEYFTGDQLASSAAFKLIVSYRF